jgi:hypothetical protein
LFADTLSRGFCVDESFGHSRLAALRAECIELAVDFLAEKIEGAAYDTAGRQSL